MGRNKDFSYLLGIAALIVVILNTLLAIFYFVFQLMGIWPFGDLAVRLWELVNIVFWICWLVALYTFCPPFRAVMFLTWKAAFRFRLFWVLAALLMGSVVVLPLLLKDDGTARGFTQILLTYTLSVITGLLGLSTLWLSCGTLARDVEEAQIQMIVVKPIARWQIWLGKWLGIMALNATLLALTGGCVYALLQWRAQKLPTQPVDQQAILRNEVLVARASLKEKMPDIEGNTDRIMAARLKDATANPGNLKFVREQIREQVKSVHQVVAPNHLRRFTIDLGWRKDSLRDTPLFVRLRFNAASTNALGTYRVVIEAGPAESPARRSRTDYFSADTFHEFTIPPNLFDEAGVLTIDVQNRSGVALLFPLEDGMEVLYRDGSFALNFARGLGIIFCWLALMASLGLASASFLSFPVAAFFSMSLLIVGLSTGTLSSAVESGTVMGANEETGVAGSSAVDYVLIPFFKSIVGVFKLVQSFSPIDALSTGRSITWGQLGLAFTQIVLLLGGVISLAGIIIFTRRELASAQTSS